MYIVQCGVVSYSNVHCTLLLDTIQPTKCIGIGKRMPVISSNFVCSAKSSLCYDVLLKIQHTIYQCSLFTQSKSTHWNHSNIMWHLTLSKCSRFVVLSRWSALQSGDSYQSDLFAPHLDLDDDVNVDLASESTQTVCWPKSSKFIPLHLDPGFTLTKSRWPTPS